MLCFVNLWKKILALPQFQVLPLRFQVSISRFWALRFWASPSRIQASFSKTDSHFFELCIFEPLVFAPCSYISKPCFSILSPTFWVWLSFFWVYLFKPYPVGFLYFFDPNLTSPDLCLRKIYLVFTTVVVRRVLKQSSWQTYKSNVSSIELNCMAIRRKL